MNSFYLILGLIWGALLLRYAFKTIKKNILKRLEERFVSIRETSDAFTVHNKKIIEKSQKLNNLKASLLEKKEREERKILSKENEVKELKQKEKLNKKQETKLEKLLEQISKHNKNIVDLENNSKVEELEKEIKELNLKSKHIAKIDLFDIAPVERYFLSKHAIKLIEKARKNAEKGLGAVEIHTEVGSKLYFMKYKKIMVIDGKTYFHNPAKVKNSWYGVPVEHFDDGDPEAKDMGNTMFYPMGGNELTALIYDQKLPDQDKSGFEINRYVLYGVMLVVMVGYLIYIFQDDPVQGAKVTKEVAQNVTTIVN